MLVVMRVLHGSQMSAANFVNDSFSNWGGSERCAAFASCGFSSRVSDEVPAFTMIIGQLLANLLLDVELDEVIFHFFKNKLPSSFRENG